MSDDFIKKEDVNRVFSGATPLPTGVRISGSFYDRAGELVDFSQTITALADQPAYIQGVIKQMEIDSLNHPTMAFREVAGFIFVYEDQTVDVRTFSSDLPDQVRDDVHYLAIESCNILDVLEMGHVPDHAIHIHTHPGMEYKAEEKKDIGLLINGADYRAYQKLSSFFSFYAGQDIPITGIVKPVGEICGDVVMTTHAGPNEFDETMRQKAGVVYTLRAAERAKRNLGNPEPN